MHSSSERVKQTLYRVKLQITLKDFFFSVGKKKVSKLLCLINWANWSEPLAYAIYLSHIMIIKKELIMAETQLSSHLDHCSVYNSF